jgi:hypothetical protein
MHGYRLAAGAWATEVIVKEPLMHRGVVGATVYVVGLTAALCYKQYGSLFLLLFVSCLYKASGSSASVVALATFFPGGSPV